MEKDLDRALEEANTEVLEGASVNALKELAALREEHWQDPRPYRLAFKALSAACSDLQALSTWEGRHELYRRLVRQEGCPERPLIFHHGLASLLTSRNDDTARAIAAELTPMLNEMLEGSDTGTPAFVLFLLVVRAVLPPDGPDARRISELHLACFRDFDGEDLALPYSVKFNPEKFGENRADLLRACPDATAALSPEAGLGLRHLLLLEWLGAGPYFTDPDNADLLEALAARLGTGAPEEDLAAARSLIIHHWRPDSVLTAKSVEPLGLGAELLTAAEALERPCFSRCDAAAKRAVSRLESRPWQAWSALRSKASRHLPGLGASQRNVRVAICVSGQLRGWRAALESWRSTLLAGADCHVFVHTWAAIGRAGAQPFRSVLPFEGAAFCDEWRRVGTLEGYEALQSRYPTLFTALHSGAKVEVDTLREAYGAQEAAVEDETNARFKCFSNQEKMHYKIHAAHQMAAGGDYDLVVRIRPDLALSMIGFDWTDMAAACRDGQVIWCDSAFGVHYGRPMIGDQIAIGVPRTMELYADTWRYHPEFAALGLSGVSREFVGHVSLAQTCWAAGIRAARVPIKIGPLLDPEPLAAGAIATALATDTAGRHDTVDAALLRANRRDLGA